MFCKSWAIAHSKCLLEPYFPPGNALSNSYFPDPTSTTTSSPAWRAPERSARPVNDFPPSLTCSSFAFGSRTVAVVFAGTSTCNAIFPSANFQPDSTCPYRVSTDAFAYVNPPPVRSQSRRRLRSHGFREQFERQRQRVCRLRVRGEPSFGRHEFFLKRSFDLFFQAFVFRGVFCFPQHFCRFCQQGSRVRKIGGLN